MTSGGGLERERKRGESKLREKRFSGLENEYDSHLYQGDVEREREREKRRERGSVGGAT